MRYLSVDQMFSLGSVRVRGLVEHLVSGHAVGGRQARDARLRANRAIPQLDVARNFVDRLGYVAAVRVAVNQHARAASAAEQLVQRQAGRLCLEVPQRSVDRGDGRHRYRPAPPVRTAVEKLPGILDLVRVSPEQARDHVLTQVRGDGELAAVQRRIPDAVLTVVGHDLERYEVTAGAGDDYACVGDLHGNGLLASGVGDDAGSLARLL